MRTPLRLLAAVTIFAVFYACAYFFMGTVSAVAKGAEMSMNSTPESAAAMANAEEYRQEIDAMHSHEALAMADPIAATSSPTLPPPTCPLLTRTLKQGQRDRDTDGQVSKLQKFLTERYQIQDNIVTGYFGPLTKKYVMEWQSQLGFDAVGYTGPLTRSAIHSLCNSPTAVGASTQTGGPLKPSGDSNQIGIDITPRITMFSVTPATGTAPVAVSVNFTINTLCKGYTLSWGDGEVAAVPGFSTTTPHVVCTGGGATVQRGHIYQIPGMYTITLGSSTAEVTITK